MKERKIIFFDGHCNLCNGFIDFVIKRDKNKKFYFASLQGQKAKEVLEEEAISELSTVVLYDNGKTFKKSQAVFKVFEDISGVWFALGIFKFLPTTITDFFYTLIAKNRYVLFGRKDICRLPTPSEKEHFLD